MNTLVNKRINLIIVSLFLFFSHFRAQTPNEDSLTVLILNSTLSNDTFMVNKNNRTLNFIVNINKPDNLNSFAVTLIDSDGKIIVDLGEYAVKKHENNFYYIENKSKEKKTVLNTEIYFSLLLKPDQFTRIKNIKLNYKSKSDKLKTAISALPNY